MLLHISITAYYMKNIYLITNIHYPAPCIKLSTKQFVLSEYTLGYLEETDLDAMFGRGMIFLRQQTETLTENDSALEERDCGLTCCCGRNFCFHYHAENYFIPLSLLPLDCYLVLSV
jgi:hypothetical protein